MANADKCFLVIPYPRHLAGLLDAMDDEGKIDKAALALAADQEFQNYKAIVLRINDPECGGDCCTEGFSRHVGYDGSIAPGDSATLEMTDPDSYNFYTPGCGGSTLPGGIWQMSFSLGWLFAGSTISGDVSAALTDGLVNHGGDVQNTAYLNANASTSFGINAAGTWMGQTDTWTPTIILNNNTNKAINNPGGTFGGTLGCTACGGVTVVPGGGEHPRMATDSTVRSVTNTLTTTTADAVTLLQGWPAVEVTNHDATNNLYFRIDGVTAVGSADGTTVVLPGSSKVARAGLIMASQTGATTTLVSVVGNGNVYTVEGVA